jgi:uncharacterized protein (TIGR00369 family)
MKYRVIGKQENSSNCIVCGLKNDLGLKAAFYELENGDVAALFTTREEHQSYPGRLHGGIAAAILDEVIGRAMMVRDKNAWGVTVELSLRYKKPIPLNEELRAVGKVIKDSRRLFEGSGEILLKSGEVAVSAVGKYMKMPIDKITDFADLEWQVTPSGADPDQVEI